MATIPAASARATCRHAAAMSASVTVVRGGIGSKRARCAKPPSHVRWRRTWSSTGRAFDPTRIVSGLGAVGRQIGGGTRDGHELAVALAALPSIVAEGADAEREQRLRAAKDRRCRRRSTGR